MTTALLVLAGVLAYAAGMLLTRAHLVTLNLLFLHTGSYREAADVRRFAGFLVWAWPLYCLLLLGLVGRRHPLTFLTAAPIEPLVSDENAASYHPLAHTQTFATGAGAAGPTSAVETRP